ncbi:MBG domain-containing protein, partial [Listeria monocytogenes]|uniref:MBG domain-containing protein n=1 Tax=Listeria monocytogenes TaxID=1639 RepID=UPI003FA42B65
QAAGAVGTGLTNYAISYGAGTLSVTPAALTITASDASKIYGSEAVLSGYAASGLVNGDSISAVSLSSSGATRTAGVGSYGISASGALG